MNWMWFGPCLSFLLRNESSRFSSLTSMCSSESNPKLHCPKKNVWFVNSMISFSFSQADLGSAFLFSLINMHQSQPASRCASSLSPASMQIVQKEHLLNTKFNCWKDSKLWLKQKNAPSLSSLLERNESYRFSSWQINNSPSPVCVPKALSHCLWVW